VFSFSLQSPGTAFIFVANSAPPFNAIGSNYKVGSPTVWVKNSQIFTYINAPTITSLRPNYVYCTRSPILITPGSDVTHSCEQIVVDVNGCGYEQGASTASYCSFYGVSTISDSKIQNAPYTRGSTTSNQQIRCESPAGTAQFRQDCVQFQNASFVMGPRNFSIAQVSSASTDSRVCKLDAASWFPLPADSQVQFTFYDDPAYLNLTIITASFPGKLESTKSLSLKFLRVSNPISHFRALLAQQRYVYQALGMCCQC
jgi:hypothetical protein